LICATDVIGIADELDRPTSRDELDALSKSEGHLLIGYPCRKGSFSFVLYHNACHMDCCRLTYS